MFSISAEKIFKDNCGNDYSNLKLEFVVKNEYMIDDDYDLETLEMSGCESDMRPKSNIAVGFESNKKSESNISDCKRNEIPKPNIAIDFGSVKESKLNTSIDLQNDKSDSKTKNFDKKPKKKDDNINHPINSRSKITNNTLPSLDPSALICPICNEEFKSHAFLLQHYAVHYSNYICKVCGEGHSSQSSLMRHAWKHTLRPHPCKQCKKSYSNKDSLNQHIRQKHIGIDLYSCELCSQRFPNYTARNHHRTKDHGILAKTYVCPSCGKCYNRSCGLSSHIRRIHQKIRNFAFTECDQKFLKKCELKRHFVKHASEQNRLYII